MSTTDQCQNYLNIFRKHKVLAPDSLDSETLDIIKKKNNLCSCNDADMLKDVLKDQLAAANTKAAVPRPKMLANNYTTNQDDLLTYNVGSIDKLYQQEKSKEGKPIDDKYILRDPFDTRSGPPSFIDRLFS
jgi:hypothetical protein